MIFLHLGLVVMILIYIIRLIWKNKIKLLKVRLKILTFLWVLAIKMDLIYDLKIIN